MKAEIRSVVEDCTTLSDAEQITFGEVVMKLFEAGVERYHADLLRAEKTYYLPDGTSHRVVCKPLRSQPSASFSAEGVEAAIRAIQNRKIEYGEFCERISAAGCVGYFVSLTGRRAVYCGRTAECHVEHFPPG